MQTPGGDEVSIWLYVAGIGALIFSTGLFALAKGWLVNACAALAFIMALFLLVMATEEADRETTERCKGMGGLWHGVDGGGICVTPDGKVLFSG
jgi:hypothetical protein